MAWGRSSPLILLGVSGSSTPFTLMGLPEMWASACVWGKFSFSSMSAAGLGLGEDRVRDLLLGRSDWSPWLVLCSITEADSDLWGALGLFECSARFGDFRGEGDGSLSESLCFDDFWPAKKIHSQDKLQALTKNSKDCSKFIRFPAKFEIKGGKNPKQWITYYWHQHFNDHI